MSRIKEYFLEQTSTEIATEIESTFANGLYRTELDAETEAFQHDVFIYEEELFMESFNETMQEMAKQFETFDMSFDEMATNVYNDRSYREMSRDW